MLLAVVLPVGIGVFVGLRFGRHWRSWRHTWFGRSMTVLTLLSALIVPHVLSWLHAPPLLTVGVGMAGLTGFTAMAVAYGSSGGKRGRWW